MSEDKIREMCNDIYEGGYWEPMIDLIQNKDKEIERLKQGYCELKEKCNRGECDCTHEEYNEMCKQNMKMVLEIERLNNIINKLEKCIKDKYYEAIDYQTKIRQSDLMQGDYPVRYYLEEQNEQLCNYFLNRLKDL